MSEKEKEEEANRLESSNLSQLVKLYQDLPARIQEILSTAAESEESEDRVMIEDE